MKALTCSLILLAYCMGGYAQTQRVTIYCTLSPAGKVNYYDLGKILPDSLQSLLVDPQQGHTYKNGLNALMWMSLHGWKLRTALSGPMEIGFLLYREIDLSPEAATAFSQGLDGVTEKKK